MFSPSHFPPSFLRRHLTHHPGGTAEAWPYAHLDTLQEQVTVGLLSTLGTHNHFGNDDTQERTSTQGPLGLKELVAPSLWLWDQTDLGQKAGSRIF